MGEGQTNKSCIQSLCGEFIERILNGRKKPEVEGHRTACLFRRRVGRGVVSSRAYFFVS